MKTVILLSDVLKLQASVLLYFISLPNKVYILIKQFFIVLEVSEYFDVLICYFTVYRMLWHTEVRYGFLGAKSHILH